MRKTKIICTLGPATKDDEVLKQLMENGMDVARINFSHGSQAEHKVTMDRVKKMRKELGRPVGILLDTSGPEIRIGQLEGGRAELLPGDTFKLTTNDIMGNKERVSITYKNLVHDVKAGTRILIDDGLIEMLVTNVTETEITCKVENGGVISDRKGINVPNVNLSMPYISPKDRSDILFGIEQGVDFIAASFVRCADDVLQLRKIMAEQGCNDIKIISKIENRQGVDNIDEILAVSDGIMVARGDMGVEIPIREVPAIQKKIIKKVYHAEKVVITATQMLDSMMKNPRPTRAEATDVANAIYDGTSAIMLSGETAAGKYPVEALKTMTEIAEYTENDIDYEKRFRQLEKIDNPDVTDAISHATCMTAIDINAAAIVTVTKSGKTARMISRYRPKCAIIGCTPSEKSYYQMNLSWGVTPLMIQEETDTEALFNNAMESAEQHGYVQHGDLAVITAGIPLGISGTTNMIKVHVVGHILVTGKGLSHKKACAGLCVCETAEELAAHYKTGDIIVVPATNNCMLPQIRTCSGLIVEEGGINSHAAIVGLSLDIPVILEAKHATKILKSGAIVTIDGEKGIVSCN